MFNLELNNNIILIINVYNYVIVLMFVDDKMLYL